MTPAVVIPTLQQNPSVMLSAQRRFGTAPDTRYLVVRWDSAALISYAMNNRRISGGRRYTLLANICVGKAGASKHYSI